VETVEPPDIWGLLEQCESTPASRSQLGHVAIKGRSALEEMMAKRRA
jgi:hypothetical protein